MIAVLDLGIDLDAWPWIWLVTAVVFALIELTIVGGSFIILPWAVSAFVAAILAFYDVQIEIQWGVFVFGGLLLFAGLYKWAQGFMHQHTMEPGVGADRLVGLTGTVTAPIDPTDTDRRGRVAIESEVWGVVEPSRAFAAGERVVITGVKGTRVTIEPAGPDDNDTPDSPAESERRE